MTCSIGGFPPASPAGAAGLRARVSGVRHRPGRHREAPVHRFSGQRIQDDVYSLALGYRHHLIGIAVLLERR